MSLIDVHQYLWLTTSWTAWGKAGLKNTEWEKNAESLIENLSLSKPLNARVSKLMKYF